MKVSTQAVDSIIDGEGYTKFAHVDPIVRKALQRTDLEFLTKLEMMMPELKLTIGNGTLLEITKKEAKILILMRLTPIAEDIERRKPFVNHLAQEAQDVILEMAYMMGVEGLMNFKKTWKYLSEYEYKKASVEMLDSKWYRDLHELDMLDGKDSENRAEKLSRRLAALEV